MARPTKKSAAKLRAKLKAENEKRKAAAKKKGGRPAGLPHYEITKERIRLGLLLGRMERQGLGELPSRGRQRMTLAQQDAAKYLIDKLVPKAVAPQSVEFSGTIIVEERNPTQRPKGYHRKPKV